MKYLIDADEAKEIAQFIFQIEESEYDYEITDTAVYDNFGVDLEGFHEIVNALFKILDFGISPLTQTAFIGFSKGNEWLVKKEVNQKFIHALINWATEGEEIPADKKGFIRTITLNGKPEYDIQISRPKISEPLS